MGYLEGIIAILCINLIFAYGVFLTAASGQLNLGGGGFQSRLYSEIREKKVWYILYIRIFYLIIWMV